MRRVRPTRAGPPAAAAAAALVLLGGCHRTLFPKDAPRTQFDLADRMRNTYVPLEEYDVFGNPQPALRARLTRRY